jgi:hypothetical protein
MLLRIYTVQITLQFLSSSPLGFPSVKQIEMNNCKLELN